MAIPDLDSEGFLPVGIHSCSFDELRERFARFQRSDRRIRLCDKLEKYVKELASTGLAKALIVDGSFVTAIDEPGDIDLVLVLTADHDMDATVRPFEYNTLSKRMVSKLYSFDLLVAIEDSPELEKYLSFFQQVKYREDRLKGVLRVQP